MKKVHNFLKFSQDNHTFHKSISIRDLSSISQESTINLPVPAPEIGRLCYLVHLLLGTLDSLCTTVHLLILIGFPLLSLLLSSHLLFHVNIMKGGLLTLIQLHVCQLTCWLWW
uniref:DnaJ protein homolog n=1 Tax=Rhizophora mucronata TaxID=61149 RepID=A0A2P2M7E7_RHIMU